MPFVTEELWERISEHSSLSYQGFFDI